MILHFILHLLYTIFLFKGIAERINSSQTNAIQLYEAMSQSGYSVGNMSIELHEFSQVSLGKGPVKDFGASGSVSCYYVPTQMALTYQGNGSFIQERGGIKLQPRLDYEKAPILNLNPSASDSGNLILRATAFDWIFSFPNSSHEPIRFVDRNKLSFGTHYRGNLIFG